MVRILKLIVVLLVLAFIGLVGFAYLGNISPEIEEVREPVELNVD